MLQSNLFANFPEDLADESFEPLLETEGFRLERILSHRHASPPSYWYDQQRAEWVVLLKGGAGLMIEAEQPEVRTLKPGDYIYLPPHCKHRVEWTEPETVWLALHIAPAGTEKTHSGQQSTRTAWNAGE